MIKVSTLVNSIVDKMRQIPELVSLLHGDENSIFAYHDVYPTKSSLALAVIELKPGQIMVAWNGSAPGPTPMGFWTHNIKVFLRGVEEKEGIDPEGYYDLFRLIFDGIPEGQALTMRQIEFVPECDPMANESISRTSDIEGVDYFEIDFDFVERIA
jgi:hypothetical protein